MNKKTALAGLSHLQLCTEDKHSAGDWSDLKDMMSALHWFCALTLALVCCLSAQPVRDDSRELLKVVEIFNELIRGEKVCDQVSELYTPTNVKMDCVHAALQCTIDELKVLKSECNISEEDDLDVYYDLVSGLEAVLNITLSKNPACQCENNEKKDTKEFVNNIIELVQQLYAQRYVQLNATPKQR